MGSSKQNHPTKNCVKNEKELLKNHTIQTKILKFRLFFDFKNGKKKRIKTKIKSQDYETFFCLSKHFVSHLAYKKSMPKKIIIRKMSILSKNIMKKSMMKIWHFLNAEIINKCKISLHTSKDRIKTSETKNRKQKILRNKSK